jgi:L-alanine-DL-glutamate epimerase-like enolase superfamily enzyme
MQITDVRTMILETPTGEPVRDAIQTLPGGRTLVVEVHTDEGHVGQCSLGASVGRTITPAIFDELRPHLLGEDPLYPKRIRQKLWDATQYFGVSGIAVFGISTLDYCLWDIVGKACGQPLYKVLGAVRDRVPAYAMVGWLNYDRERLYRQCATAVERGLRGVKIKVGAPDLAEDVWRIETAQKATGERVPVMVDANQVFDTHEAIRRGRVYEQMGVYWYEEPLRPWNKDGYAELAAALTVPIATGENEYTKHAIRELLVKRGVDIVQPDARRTGGVSEIMEIAAMCDAFNVTVASHGGWERNVQLWCAMPNGIYLEAGGSTETTIYEEPVRIVDGEVVCPQGPGFGLVLRRDYVERHRVA